MAEAQEVTTEDQGSTDMEIVETPSTMPSCSGNITTQAERLLARPRAPCKSDLTRPRKIRQNVGTRTQKSKPSCNTDPAGISPAKHVHQFPTEAFTVSAGKLFCSACREEVSLKTSIIRSHMKSNKHQREQEAVARREAQERGTVDALKDYDKQAHPTGETVPKAQRVFRVKVVKSFLRGSIPLNKKQYFHELLTEHAYKLANNRGTYDLIPFVMADEVKRIKAEIDSKKLSVIFDGTTRLGKALAIVVHFMTGWTI